MHDMLDVNWFAVVAAAVSAFVLGGLWYGPLFKNAWCREAGMDPNAPPKGHPAKTFGVAVLLSLITAWAFAWFLPARPDLVVAVRAGALIGALYVATSFGINYAFAQRSFKLWAIDAGYHTLQFTLYGLILGLWH